MDVDKELLEQAVKTWGINAQVNMAVEECGELLASLMQWRRTRPVRPEEEIADVIIMMHQLAIIFGTERVQQEIYLKMDRLRGKLKATSHALNGE